MPTRTYAPESDLAVAKIVARVITDHPLPASPAGLSYADRKRLELAAEEKGLAPEALLALVRAEHARIVADARTAR